MELTGNIVPRCSTLMEVVVEDDVLVVIPIMATTYRVVLLHIIVEVIAANVLISELSPRFPRCCLRPRFFIS